MDAFEFAVADDLSIRVICLQRAEQREEREFLGRCPGVGSTALFVETPFIADANGVGIVMAGMGSDHLLGTTEVQLSVAGNVVVIAAALPATGLVHLVELFQRNVLVRA